jgi:peptidoglycan/xylan/chitin deacetylase (PgdA/CDA1 family)
MSALSALDRARRSLPPGVRRAARNLVDPLLRPVGSIAGAKDVTTSFALTFDDGPSPDGTPAVLAMLERHRATATFFVLVDRAVRFPELLAEVRARGHEVALHGADHRRMTSIPPAELRRWVRTGRESLEDLVGEPVEWFRPPYGAQSVRSYRAARAEHLDVVVWTADVQDWTTLAPADMASLAVQRVAPGGVLLMHDAYASERPNAVTPLIDRAATVDLVLTELKARGLVPVSVGRMVRDSGCRRTAWFRA